MPQKNNSPKELTQALAASPLSKKHPKTFGGFSEAFIHQGPPLFFKATPLALLTQFISDRFTFFNKRPSESFTLRFSALSLKKGEESTLLEILTTDRSFLTDSVLGVLREWGYQAQVVFHPIVQVARDDKGLLVSLDGTNREVYLSVIIEAVPEENREGLEADIAEVLGQVVAVVEDFPDTVTELEALESALATSPEGIPLIALLRWLRADNFIFQGFLPAQKKGKNATFQFLEKKGLGLFRPGPKSKDLGREVCNLLNQQQEPGPFLKIVETEHLGTVHRRNNLTGIFFSQVPGDDATEGGVILGLFTHHSLRQDVRAIPLVREKILEQARMLGLLPGSHKHKQTLDFLNGLPRFELFRLQNDSLKQLMVFFLSVVDHPRVDVGVHSEAGTGILRILVSQSRLNISRDKNLGLKDCLSQFLGLPAYGFSLVEVGPLGMAVAVFQPPNPLKIDQTKLLEAVVQQLQTRKEKLLQLWKLKNGVETAPANAILSALPEEYLLAHPNSEVVSDLNVVEKILHGAPGDCLLRTLKDSTMVKLVLYSPKKISLSRILPILTNLRVITVEEQAYQIRSGERSAHIQNFLLTPPEGSVDPENDGERLKELIFGILEQTHEDNPLNGLWLACKFDLRRITLMMLLRNYLMQVGTVYTRKTINDTLIRRAEITMNLFAVFEARFDPHIKKSMRKNRIAEREGALAKDMAEIDNLTEDRIFRRLLNLIQAALRTNYYLAEAGDPLAMKFASTRIDDMIFPKPMYEIFMYSGLMEGIHLRGGMVARGGLRYSDRPDDFRTEVLGLMHAQMKKNALIVPLGAKGGFVVKNLDPFGGDARKAGDNQYRVFINTLLSLTDNLVGDKLVPPEKTVRYDEDDPYLVVAADKGTAHLSDTANAIAQERGFWLDDAFASGGSNGYDHKVVGITARGAWESVKRHFWEMNIDLTAESITVVGLGDMSGDVFGNGLLSTPHLKLVGAFNHLHIFLDPDPEPKASYKERKRLFGLPRSTWKDYNPSLISPGGGIFERSAKSIALSPQVQAVLDLETASLSGEEMISALLSAPVDLVWNGGIGTYYKSKGETHDQVGDHANDEVRVNASQAQAKVIGEGGNLGLTQAARMDLDEKGIRLNTDAIDNAGGVHMSDREVNLKILLGELLKNKTLKTTEARNLLLQELTDEVTEAVLHANYLQAMILSQDRIRSGKSTRSFIQLVDTLAASGVLDRRSERVPGSQQFQQYQADGRGIPRPLLSVLLSLTKMALYQKLENTPLLSEPYTQRFYLEYFPLSLRKAHKLEAVEHPLKPQIISTSITNRVVDQVGMTFVAETADFTGAGWDQVVRAYLLADEVTGGQEIRDHVYSLDFKAPAQIQYEVLMELEAFVGNLTQGFLLHAPKTAFDAIPAMRKALEAYRKTWEQGSADEALKEISNRSDIWIQAGVDENLARKTAEFSALNGFLETYHMAESWKMPFSVLMELEAAIHPLFRFSTLESAIRSAPLGDAWAKSFADNLLRTLIFRRQKLFETVLSFSDKGKPGAWVETCISAMGPLWKHYENSLNRVLSQSREDLVALAVVVGELEGLIPAKQKPA